MNGTWRVIIKPITFEPILVLHGFDVEISIHNHKINDSEVMRMLIEKVPEEKIVDAFIAYKGFRGTNDLNLPTN